VLLLTRQSSALSEHHVLVKHVTSFPAYKAAGLTMIAPSASAVSLTNPKAPDRGFPIFHRVVAHDGFQAPALARYAAKGVTAP
jgi:branched-chain amino acid transport system substrate-binding protein